MSQPMLAAKLDWRYLISDIKGDGLRFPVYVSPKIDGIRCVIDGAKPMSRSWKVLPNRALQSWVRHNRDTLEHLDGELVVGPPNASDVYNKSMSGIMSQNGAADFRYLVFDYVAEPDELYENRLTVLQDLSEVRNVYCPERVLPSTCEVLPQVLCRTRTQVEEIEAQCQEKGFEGVIVRRADAPYKYGRSTAREGYLLKLKRYEDAEAIVIGTEELYHNQNEATVSPTGHTARSSHKAGQVAGDTLGALVCKLPSGVIFKIGSGFDAQTRKALWLGRSNLPGKIVKFKFMPYGMLESTGVPRFPIFLDWRDPIDM